MHTLSSVEQLTKQILFSLPIKVWFAGFESDTLQLARSGWELSMRQMNMATSAGHSLQLAMKLGERNYAIYALSRQIDVGWAELQNALQGYAAYSEFLMRLRFEIQCIGPSIKMQVMPAAAFSRSAFLNEWQPIDPVPQERTESIDLAEFQFFKTGKPDLKDIVVIPEMVPELMELVLKAQAPMLDEIKRREQSRRNFEQYGDLFAAKPARTVQAQIITLAG